MNIVLWILQIILGIKLVSMSVIHGLNHSKDSVQQAINKFGRAAKPLLVLAAICSFLGAVGLVLPEILGWSSKVIVATAVVTALMLLGSIAIHIRAREKPKVFVSIVLFIIAVFIAFGRWYLAP